MDEGRAHVCGTVPLKDVLLERSAAGRKRLSRPKEVLDVMIELAQEGMTMLVVTHEMGFARRVAHRVLFMDGGRVVEENTPEEFFSNPKHERTRLFLSQILH